MDELKQTVARIEFKVNTIAEQQAVTNHIVAEHHRRSTLLEESLTPIKTHVALVQKILYFCGAILIAVATQWIHKLFS